MSNGSWDEDGRKVRDQTNKLQLMADNLTKAKLYDGGRKKATGNNPHDEYCMGDECVEPMGEISNYANGAVAMLLKRFDLTVFICGSSWLAMKTFSIFLPPKFS